MRRVVFAIFAVFCIALSGSAHAACGGGGWKSSSKQASAQGTSSAQEEAEPDYDRYFDPPRSKPLDTTHFDAIAAKLELSKEQSAKIEEAKQAIRKQVRTLNVTKFNTERAFDACNGDCEKERVAMRKALAAAQQYSADAEFEKQLHAILSEKQIASYAVK